MKQRAKWVTLSEQHGARDSPLQQSVFCTYVSDFVSSCDDTDVVGQKNRYCCQHVFILIWPCIINLTQQAHFLLFRRKCAIKTLMCLLRLNFEKCQISSRVARYSHRCKLWKKPCPAVSFNEWNYWKWATRQLNEKWLNDARCSPFPQTCISIWPAFGRVVAVVIKPNMSLGRDVFLRS